MGNFGKQILVFSVVAILAFLALPSTVLANTPSPWAVEQVNNAISKNLVPPNLQSNFTRAITRAEFSALAVTLYEAVRSEITGRTTFTDTSDVNVEKAAFIRIVYGVGDNRFDPNGTLTREQAAVMLSRLAHAIGNPLPRERLTFADMSDVSSWAVESIEGIVAAGIMSGVGDNRFAPQQPYTIEQSIVTIMRLFDRTSIATEALAGFIEIRDNTLYITPVEVFMLYDASNEFETVRDSALRSIVYIEISDSQRLEALGLTLDDFPSGSHIRPNWHSERQWHYVEQANIETLSFEITSESEFVFVDNQLLFDTTPEGNRLRTTNVLNEFMQYFFPSVVHFIEVYDGRVIRLVQEFGFTI